MTSHFLIKMQSSVAATALDRLILSLNNRFEEFLLNEIFFVKDCYKYGATLWWRRLLHIGTKTPSDAQIRTWITNRKNPPIWLGLNPRVIPAAAKHYFKKCKAVTEDLQYATYLRKRCDMQDEIVVFKEFVTRFPVLKQKRRMRENDSVKYM